MPKKPSTLYILVEPKQPTGSQVSSTTAWKLDLEGSIEDTLKRNASLFPIGQTLVTVTDTKTTRYSTAPALTEVEEE